MDGLALAIEADDSDYGHYYNDYLDNPEFDKEFLVVSEDIQTKLYGSS